MRRLLTTASAQFKSCSWLCTPACIFPPPHLPGAFFNTGDTLHSKLWLKIDPWSSRFNPANSISSFPFLLLCHQLWGDGRVRYLPAIPGSPQCCPRTSPKPGCTPLPVFPKLVAGLICRNDSIRSILYFPSHLLLQMR